MNLFPLARLLRPAALLVLVAALAACANQVTRNRLEPPLSVDTIRLAHSNVHLVRVAQARFLVDAGGQASAAALVEELSKLGVSPEELAGVILTHGHADHAGGAAALQKLYGVRVVAGAGDAAMLGSGRNDKLCPTGFMARRLLARAQEETFDPMRADLLVSGSTSLAEALGVAGLPGRLVPVPGHTPGSLVVEMGAIAFVGDIVRGGVISNQATRHFFMCDVADNDGDIRAVLERIAPGAQTFFTGHFGPVGRASLEAFAKAR